MPNKFRPATATCNGKLRTMALIAMAREACMKDRFALSRRSWPGRIPAASLRSDSRHRHVPDNTWHAGARLEQPKPVDALTNGRR